MLNILLIEDEFIIAKDIKTLLGKNNYAEVDIAKNYQTALTYYLQNNYHLIISDINLNSHKDGIDIIEEFSKIKKTPVVYLTAYSDKDIIKRAEKTMPFAFILKPYNNNQLIATINLALLNFKKDINNINKSEENTVKLNLLTSREKEILIVLSSGKLSKEIAELLNISTNTVEQHKKNIRKKLNLKTVGELINFTLSTRLFELR
ncbi:response regulator [Xanthomarina sp. F2636L]|uniref:response regulator n=1 Tax=Xanthomarina sp. F2636L TaxID=2996018 RepID=UPI00225E2CFC|nr:response regulator [Xanthomarina sp. F2636L]MCX7549413.1 response regulator [Xanthomarina sp. F2636L]